MTRTWKKNDAIDADITFSTNRIKRQCRKIKKRVDKLPRQLRLTKPDWTEEDVINNLKAFHNSDDPSRNEILAHARHKMTNYDPTIKMLNEIQNKYPMLGDISSHCRRTYFRMKIRANNLVIENWIEKDISLRVKYGIKEDDSDFNSRMI